MTSDRELTEQRAIGARPSDAPAAPGDGEGATQSGSPLDGDALELYGTRGPFGEPAGRGTSVGSPPVYPVEGWHIRETDFDLDSLPQSETIFSLSNGYLGLRGNLEEGAPAFERGTYVNGFYESRPIVYPEAAYGYAQDDQAMLNVTDGKMISLKVDGDTFDVREGELIEHNRVLDLRRGFVGREVVWESPSGRRISVRTRRLVSLTIPHLACMEYEVEALGPDSASPMTMELTSHLVANESDLRHSDDPREMAAFWGQVLKPVWGRADGERIGLGHRVERAKLSVFCLTDHVLDVPGDHEAATDRDDDSQINRTYTFELHSGQSAQLRKYLVYCYGPDAEADEIPARIDGWMDEVVSLDFEDLLDAQVNRLDEFWRECHIDIVGDDSLRQAVRFALFQVLQASALTDCTGIPAKGLTGQGYNGHYFWDMETYVLHVLTYLSPGQALQSLKYRHATLDRARARALELSKRGALFPWRTINGEEASSFFPAGTAEYHINADIAHAVRHYTEITGDDEFLFGEGIDILAETARFWVSLGFFNPERDGRFCLNAVTGPDEYTALVDNNTFTNLMAKSNLAYAAAVVERMAEEAPDAHADLVRRLGLDDDEVAEWRAAAESMYVHYDEERALHGQDDSFLDKQPWDFEGTPAENYPLLLHYHPLDLYRSQVIKQADLVMAMFLQGSEFTDEQKRRNFDYYDPITTADSSLSMCIQAIMAAEVGDLDRAWEYTQRTALTDLHNVQHNVHDGIHIASQAGTWLALACGFGGLRNRGGVLHFRPQLPPGLEALGFRCRADGAVVELLMTTHWVTYSLVAGTSLEIVHNGEPLTLLAGEPRHINW